MNALYRVMMTRPGESDPELWTNYPTAEDAEQAARGLVGGGDAIRSEVSEISGPNPEDARFVAGFEMTANGKIERHTEPPTEQAPEPARDRQQRPRSRGIERRAQPAIDALSTDSQLMLTAIHEAGHAVCDTLHGFRVRKVTIKPGRGTAGRCIGEHVIPVERLREKIRGFCAGYVAETLCYPHNADHEAAQPDLEEAEELLRVLFPGQDITDEALAVYDETAAILRTRANLRAILLVADCLYIHTTISGERVREIVALTREADGGGR